MYSWGNGEILVLEANDVKPGLRPDLPGLGATCDFKVNVSHIARAHIVFFEQEKHRKYRIFKHRGQGYDPNVVLGAIEYAEMVEGFYGVQVEIPGVGEDKTRLSWDGWPLGDPNEQGRSML